MKEIRKIVEMYDQTNFSEEKLALAVVVNIEESAYRRIGARMLVSSTGKWTGGISGGCLEGDALQRSLRAIFKNKPSQVTYNTLEDDENEIGIGLGCNGKIDVLFVPVDPLDEKNPVMHLKRMVESNCVAVQLQIISTNSHSEEKLGQTQLIFDDIPEEVFGISGDELSGLVRNSKLQRRPQIVDIKDDCGKATSILVEFVRPETKLVIIGDNYDVTALMGLAMEMGYEIHLVGRKKKMTKEQFRMASSVYEYEDFSTINVDDFTAIILMTHDFEWDKNMLPRILHLKPRYVGMLGPRKRRKKLEDELGIDSFDQWDFFHSPVGVDIGAETPEEIAIAIIAELISVFRERKGGSLRLRKETIHQRM